MMKRILITFFSFVFSIVVYSQEYRAVKDTTTMPRLEIPEITIVGKKAITLPFARKGEIYDVNIYEAPPPDTSLLGTWYGASLPIGALPRYDEPLVPWHFSVEGLIGSFSTGHLKAFVDYKSRDWGIYGNAGFSSTNGHTAHASGKSFNLQTTAHSIVSTDNEILGSFRTSGSFKFNHDKYGMFGLKSLQVDRSRDDVSLNARLSSIERDKNFLTLDLSANICSINDVDSSIDHKSSGVSPELNIFYRTQVENVLVSSRLIYKTSSLNYNLPVQTPSMLNFGVGGEWKLSEKWFIDVGGNYFSGNASDGGTYSMLFPFANVRFELARDREINFWYKPEMLIKSYSDFYFMNPYLTREILIKPERKPINFGGSFWYNSEKFSVELNGSISIDKGKSVYISYTDSMAIDNVDANTFIVQANGWVKPIKELKIKFSGNFQPSFLKGTHHQLPMTPLIQVGGRGEFNLNIPFTPWTSIEYWSKQNVDYNGDKTLRSRFLLGVGVFTSIIPKTILSFEIDNLLNDAYDWWYNYVAPGRSFKLEAKVNIQ